MIRRCSHQRQQRQQGHHVENKRRCYGDAESGRMKNPVRAQNLLSNVLSLGGGETLARVVAFFGTAYLARVLGPEGFGLVGFATAVCGYLALSNWALNDIGAREVAKTPREAGVVGASVIAVKLLLATTGWLILVLVFPLLGLPQEARPVILFAGLLLFAMAMDGGWILKGLEQSRMVGVAQVLGQILFVALVFLLVHAPVDIAFAPLAQFIGEFAAALLLGVWIFHAHRPRIDWRRGFSVLRAAGFLIVSRVFRTLIFSFDVLLLGFLLTQQDVGLYTAPYRVVFLLLAIAVAIYAAYLPAYTRAAELKDGQLSDLVNRSLELAAAAGIPLAVGGMVLAEPLLTLLFGSAYAGGAGAFRWLLLGVAVIFLYSGARNVLIVLGQTRTDLALVATAAAINVALNCWVIPRYGIEGAALVTALSESLILVGVLWVVRRVGVNVQLSRLARPLLAALIMAAVLLYAVPGLPLGLKLVLGCATYAASLLMLGGVPEDARPWLHTIGIAAGTTGYNKRKAKLIALQQQEIDDNPRKSSDSQYPPGVTDHSRGHAWKQDQ